MSALEKQSLEAHVDLCQLRYEQLDLRLTIVEKKLADIQQDILDGHKSMKATVITASGSIVVAIVGVVTTILMKF